jgi:competence protein ComEC
MRRQRFLFQIESVLEQPLSGDVELTGALLQLSLYSPSRGSHSHPHSYSSPKLLPKLAPGQRWLFTVKLRRPRGFVNPAGMDYHAYLLRKGVAATGYVMNKSSRELLGSDCIYAVMDCVRWWVKQALQSRSQSQYELHNNPQIFPKFSLQNNAHNELKNKLQDINSVITALAVGDTQAISAQQWQIFKNTGTVHLLAISGLHIGLAAMIGWVLGYSAMRLLGICSPFAISLRTLPIVSSVIMALSYSLLAGMSLPTQRAFIMILAYQLTRLYFYRLSPWVILSIALFGVSVLDPLAVHSMGFWLSFLAVAILLYGFLSRPQSTLTRVTGFAIQSVNAQWLLFLGLLLPSLLWLQGGSSSAPLVNMLAIPWVSLLIVPAMFLLLFLFALQVIFLVAEQGALAILIEFVYGWIARSIDYLLQGLGYFNQILGGFWFANIPQPSVYVMLLAAVGIVYLLTPKGVPYRRCAFILLLPVVLPTELPFTVSPVLKVTFLDVGQGTSVVVETLNHRLVYDTGRRFSHRFNTGEHIIAPYLRSTGRAKLNRLIVSHSDSDHAGGLPGLLRTVSVDRVMYGEFAVAMMGETNGSVIRRNGVNDSDLRPTSTSCHRGQQWRWDGVDFRVLWPSSEITRLSDQKSNNHSCVLLISVGNKHVLLTGDIEKEVESLLLNDPVMPRHIDIMLVPHHGSKTSSTKVFVDDLKPYFAVVTAGYQNQYHHPSQQVLMRYQQVGSDVINTATAGAVQFSLYAKGERWTVDKWREKYRRYWY